MPESLETVTLVVISHPPYRVGFLQRFGLKTGIHSAHFGLESGIIFEGTATEPERI